MPCHTLKTVAGLMLCAMLAWFQQPVAGGSKAGGDHEPAQEEAGNGHELPAPGNTAYGDPAIQPASIQVQLQHDVAVNPVIGLAAPAAATRAITIRGPPPDRNNPPDVPITVSTNDLQSCPA